MTETIIDGEAFNIIVEGKPEAPAIYWRIRWAPIFTSSIIKSRP